MSSPTEFGTTQDQYVSQLVDANPEETAEWQQSLDSLISHAGPVRARYLMLNLLKRAHEQGIALPNLRLKIGRAHV